MKPIDIGIRWSAQHIVRRDDEKGMFCELNSRLESGAESDIQRALLIRVDPRLAARIQMARDAKRINP